MQVTFRKTLYLHTSSSSIRGIAYNKILCFKESVEQSYLLNKFYKSNIWFLTLALQENVFLLEFLDWFCHLVWTYMIRVWINLIEHIMQMHLETKQSTPKDQSKNTFSISCLNVSKTSLLFTNASCKVNLALQNNQLSESTINNYSISFDIRK